MTGRFARNAGNLGVSFFVALVTPLIALPLLAQQTGTTQPKSTRSQFLLVPDKESSLHATRPAAPSGTTAVSPPIVRKKKAALRMPDSGSASFLAPLSFDSGCLPWSIAVGDFNGDGKPDLVVADWYQGCSGGFGLGEVGVLLGNGDGTFQPPVFFGSGGAQALAVAVGDLNGDGKADLVVANSCTPANDDGCADSGGQIGVLLGNGDGTFQPVVSYFSGDALANSVRIADVNGDGHLDLVVGNACLRLNGGGCTNPGSTGVLLGNGNGTFQPAVRYPADVTGTGVSSLAVGDLNVDGHPDVVMVGGEDVGVISVLLGNGNGTFQPEFAYDTAGYEPNSVATADVNGDGKPDVVVASYCAAIGDCNGGVVGVFLGNGDGTLQAPVLYSAGGFGAWFVAISDVDGDGHPDLIVATNNPNMPGGSGPGQLSVLVGNGNGTFKTAEAFPSGGDIPRSLAVADVNGDGKPDLLVENFCGSQNCNGHTPGIVGVLLNDLGTPQKSTTTALVCAPAQSAYGQTVNCTVTVTAASGKPAGTVIVYDIATPAGSAALVNGKAVVPVSSLAVGTHSLMAVFQGSSGFAPSSSGLVTQVVVMAPTTVSMAASPNPAGIGQLVTFTATVIGQYGGGTATGTLFFQAQGGGHATVQISGNQASFATTFVGRGARGVTATYSGDANNQGSTSPVFKEVIGIPPFPSKTTVTTSGSPSQVGQPVTFTASVTFSGNPVPNGEVVTFHDGSSVIGTGTTAGGLATFTTSSLKAKTHTIKATYGGDGTLKPSNGKVIQVVTQ